MPNIVPSEHFVAIQQVQGLQPTAFMKLKRPWSLNELKFLPMLGEKAELPLDREWMLHHNFNEGMVQSHCATSAVKAVEIDKHGLVLVKTQNSVYQAIPDFS